MNASAGKASNLNADKLDGKSSEGFYAAGSQVADSSKLAGKNPDEVLPLVQAQKDVDPLVLLYQSGGPPLACATPQLPRMRPGARGR